MGRIGIQGHPVQQATADGVVDGVALGPGAQPAADGGLAAIGADQESRPEARGAPVVGEDFDLRPGPPLTTSARAGRTTTLIAGHRTLWDQVGLLNQLRVAA